jgi:hypothetical protein
MRVLAFVAASASVLVLAGCVSPEEQRAMDQAKCSGFGFAPGTEAFAHCMMGISQQREAQEAADRRQQQLNAAIADQAQRDREAQATRDAANRTATPPVVTPVSTPSIDIPKIDVPKIDVPSAAIPDGMKCTRTSTTTGNAGTLTENCHN